MGNKKNSNSNKKKKEEIFFVFYFFTFSDNARPRVRARLSEELLTSQDRFYERREASTRFLRDNGKNLTKK